MIHPRRGEIFFFSFLFFFFRNFRKLFDASVNAQTVRIRDNVRWVKINPDNVWTRIEGDRVADSQEGVGVARACGTVACMCPSSGFQLGSTQRSFETHCYMQLHSRINCKKFVFLSLHM